MHIEESIRSKGYDRVMAMNGDALGSGMGVCCVVCVVVLCLY